MAFSFSDLFLVSFSIAEIAGKVWIADFCDQYHCSLCILDHHPIKVQCFQRQQEEALVHYESAVGSQTLVLVSWSAPNFLSGWLLRSANEPSARHHRIKQNPIRARTNLTLLCLHCIFP